MVLDAIVQHVQKEYDEGADIAQSLEELKLLNLSVMPVRQVSIEKDADARKQEQETFNYVWNERVKAHLKRERTLKANTSKAYALIMSEYCNPQMQMRIEEHPEFDVPDINKKIKNNPLLLL